MAGLVLSGCTSGADDVDTEAAPSAADTATSDAATEPGDTEAGTSSASSTSSGGGGGELVFGIAQDIPILDGRLPGGSAASFSALRHINEPLVFFDPSGETIPVLAESWEQVEPDRWSFTLREGVTFHNGTEFTAETAAESINMVLEEDFTPWFDFAVGGVVTGAEVVDDTTIEVTTASPTPNVPELMTVIDMVDPTYSVEDQNTTPVGTGPFTFVEYTPRDSLVLERYDDYWGEAPSYSDLTFRIIPEQSTRVQALLADEVDVINNISPEDIARIEEADNAKVVSSPTTRHVMIALRHDREPLDDPLVRQAMNYAVDKDEIVNTLLNGIAEPAPGLLSEQLPCAVTDLGPWPHDPEQATQLLEEAGYDGEEITIAIGAGRYPNDDLVGQAVVSQLQEVGLNINLEAIDYSTMQTELGLREEAQYDAWLQGWGASLLDSPGMLQAFFGGEDAALPLFYDNADYQSAIDEALAATSDDERCEALERAQEIAWEDAGGIFLYFPVDNLGVAADVEGIEARFDEFFFGFPGVTVG